MDITTTAPVADPEQLARNLLFPLLNPPQSFGAVSAATAGPSSSAVAVSDPISAPAVRRTSALDLLLMTEGEARQFSESMLAGSSLAPPPSAGVHPDRPSHVPTGLTPVLRSFTASTPASGAQQIFKFSAPSSATTSDVRITPSSSSSAAANQAVPSSAGPSSSAGAGPSTSEYHAGFRRSEAAKCRRVYGAIIVRFFVFLPSILLLFPPFHSTSLRPFSAPPPPPFVHFLTSSPPLLCPSTIRLSISL
ncbi:hypothetical protein Aperf_G00000070860 [Anoplocephala perfoliata]